MAAGEVPEVPQDEAQATYAPRLVKEDGLIDWARPARAIHDQVRALAPMASRLHVRPARPPDPAPLRLGEGSPPELARARSSRRPELTAFAWRRDAVCSSILELQAEGGKVMPARSFLAGHPLAAGDRLGAP